MSSNKPPATLWGVSVALSGAVPEREHWTEPAMDRSILEFVASFVQAILERGGRVVHGSHPAFTPIVLHQAKEFATEDVRPVTLVTSRLWDETLEDYRRLGVQRLAELIITEKVGEGGIEDAETRNASLTEMRRNLIAHSDVVVAVGGLLHQASTFTPGVVEELELAKAHRIPRIIVGGLGGKAAELCQVAAEGDALLEVIHATDIGHCVQEVVDALERMIARGTLAPPTLSFLHLTDLHVGQSKEAGRYPNIIEALKRDLALQRSLGWSWDAVFFTGDLAFRGDGAELAVATLRIREILEHIRGLTGRMPHFFAIPGNHDLSRPAVDEAKRWLELWKQPNARQMFFSRSSHPLRRNIDRLFASYHRWQLSLPRPESLNFGLFPGEFSASISAHGVRLGIVGLNTALFHWGDEVLGRLTVDVAQLRKVAGDSIGPWSDKHHFNVLLTHHPADWLDEEGLRQLETEIYQHDRFNLHLFGHMHSGTHHALAGPRGICHRHLGRALFGAEEDGYGRMHGYTMGRLRLVSTGEGWRRELELVPREAARCSNGWSFGEEALALTHRWSICAKLGSSRTGPDQAAPTRVLSWPEPRAVINLRAGERLQDKLGALRLSGPAIFLSAGVPEAAAGEDDAQRELIETANAGVIRDVVRRICQQARDERIRIVFGGQPGVVAAVLPEKQGAVAGLDPWLIFFQHRCFELLQPEESQALAAMSGVQCVWVEGKASTTSAEPRAGELLALRQAMFEIPELVGAVFVGGKGGIESEFKLFTELRKGLPRVAVAAGGGAARALLFSHAKGARGHLTDSARLHGSGGDVVAAVFDGLRLRATK